mmetsp:Transcript_92151/g.206023  ORF Transcript_92151/g.206023 Transcript_92151/m.206023 type:complete len:359 (+) Transcript_92151:113-1189(+)
MRGHGNHGGATHSRTISDDFANFQSECPLLRMHQPRSEMEWSYYQAGPMCAEPIIFLHSTSGTAAAFFYQVQVLAKKGYRVLSVQYPGHASPEAWCKGFDLFLDYVRCRAAHFFGAGLGGFLVQHLAANYPHRVRSLILCNAFATTRAFAEEAGTLGSMISLMPSVVLRKVLLDAFPQGGAGMELAAKQAVDWVALQVNDLSGTDLAGRLSLNCTPSFVGAMPLEQRRVTVMESSGETMVPEQLRRQLRGIYPEARLAQLKASGDFPYLSRPDETTLFIEVHMRGVGVFPADNGAGAAAAASVAAAQSSRLAWEASGGGAKPQAGFAVAAAEEEVEAVQPPPQRRPVWRNPFEDDPLL